MRDKILALVNALSGVQYEEMLLDSLCEAVCGELNGLLQENVTPEDCGEAYPLAAAWILWDWLRGCGGMEGVTSISAGDMVIRRQNGSGRLEERAKQLLRPWLRDPNFVFLGVKG